MLGTKDNCCDNLTPFQGHTFVACPITAKYCVETPFYLRGTHIPYVPYTCISYFSVEYVAALSLIAKSPALIINSLKSSFNGIGFFISTFYVKHFCFVFSIYIVYSKFHSVGPGARGGPPLPI